MRLWSTPESVRAGEPSALAIIETLAAMAGSVWIGVYFGTWWHVFVGALIAPLLLLRTDLSCKMAWRIARPLENWCRRGIDATGPSSLWVAASLFVMGGVAIAIGIWILSSAEARWPLLIPVLWLIFTPLAMGTGLIGPIARALGALCGVYASPSESIRAIPRNWWRAIAALDFARPPEVLPLPDDRGWERPDLMFKDELAGHALRSWCLSFNPFLWVRVLFTPITFVVPAVCFRLSLKSTALLWLPLLWALRPLKPPAEAWSAHLRLKATSDINQLVAIFSTMVLSGLAVKYVLLVAKHELALEAEAWHGWLGQRLGEFVAALVRPGEFPIWQLASATNGVLGLVAFFLFRAWARRDKVGLPVPDLRIDRTLGVMYFFRRLLSSYAIVCNGVVMYQLARTLPLPKIGWKLFPWL